MLLKQKKGDKNGRKEKQNWYINTNTSDIDNSWNDNVFIYKKDK